MNSGEFNKTLKKYLQKITNTALLIFFFNVNLKPEISSNWENVNRSCSDNERPYQIPIIFKV